MRRRQVSITFAHCSRSFAPTGKKTGIAPLFAVLQCADKRLSFFSLDRFFQADFPNAGFLLFHCSPVRGGRAPFLLPSTFRVGNFPFLTLGVFDEAV